MHTYNELVNGVNKEFFGGDTVTDHTRKEARGVGGPMVHHVSKHLLLILLCGAQGGGEGEEM